jgi:hypothetical protein
MLKAAILLLPLSEAHPKRTLYPRGNSVQWLEANENQSEHGGDTNKKGSS